MVAALTHLSVLGVTTNRDFLIDVLSAEEFVGGGATTDFLDGWTAPAPADTERAHALALGAALIMATHGGLSWRSTGMASVPLRLLMNEANHDVRIAGRFGAMKISVGETTFELTLTSDGGALHVTEDGATRAVPFAARDNHLYFIDGGRTWAVEDMTFAPPEAAVGAAGAIRAPMAGRIVSVRVKDGGSAAKGAIVVTLEAMKMEHELTAAVDATVEAVHVAEGDQVAAKQLLVTLAAPD
jgi:acetyl/propionyl-CoA carboxylase alpha subunit